MKKGNTSLEKKFFYDHFAPEDVAGLFNLTHLLYVIVFFALLSLALYRSRGMTDKVFRRLYLAVAVGVTVGEGVKIALRIFKNQWIDSWIPLYFCSLFLFAVWLPYSRHRPLKRAGYAYMTMGGIPAAICFTLYPSTSLALFPLFHPSTIYSGVFHFAMLYLGIMLLLRGEYRPEWRDGGPYFLFILFFAIPSVILNRVYGTNCLFLRHAFKLPFLEPIIALSPYLYMALAFLAQSVLIFLVPCGLTRLIEQKRAKKLDTEKEMSHELS